MPALPLSASAPAIVWLVVGLCSTLAVLAVTIGLVRHVLVLARTLGRFRDEIQPVAEEVGAQGRRASNRSGRLGERPLGRS